MQSSLFRPSHPHHGRGVIPLLTRLSAGLMTIALSVVLVSGCGSSGNSFSAVDRMPSRASDKAMDKAESCDDGDMKACNWVGIWFMVGGAGKSRKREGRRFLRHACNEDYKPSCKLLRALDRRSSRGSSRSSSASRGLTQRSESALPYSAPDNVRNVARQCDRGMQKSCHAVGAWLLLGKGDTPGKKRRVAGLRIIQKNCKNGYAKSCTLIQKLKALLAKKKRNGSI